jgi:hypothetical protein
LTSVRQGLDLLIALFGAAAWSFAAFAFGSRFVSPTAGGLLAAALFFSSLALVISSHIQEQRMNLLVAGTCPRCRSRISMEHRHRRWGPARAESQPALNAWECNACAYSHSEAWPCPQCPADP